MTTQTKEYVELLRRAEETQSRSEAIYLINLADKLRMKKTNEQTINN